MHSRSRMICDRFVYSVPAFQLIQDLGTTGAYKFLPLTPETYMIMTEWEIHSHIGLYKWLCDEKKYVI
jgi:hypothetical protein